MQGNWIRRCDYIKLDLSWKSLMSLPQPLVSFCIQSAFNILPCPSNLFRWKLSEDSSCSLCKSPKATVAHVLSGCKITLDQQCYTYRHDSILRIIVECLSEFISSYSPSSPPKLSNSFVRAGSKTIKKSLPDGILFCSR